MKTHKELAEEKINGQLFFDTLPKENFSSNEAYYDYILLNFGNLPDEQLKWFTGMTQDYLDTWREAHRQMQSVTQTAIENVRRNELHERMNMEKERVKQRTLAIINYWIYEGTNEQMLVAQYVKELEEQIKTLIEISSN